LSASKKKKWLVAQFTECWRQLFRIVQQLSRHQLASDRHPSLIWTNKKLMARARTWVWLWHQQA